jgi:hypothetical protein
MRTQLLPRMTVTTAALPFLNESFLHLLRAHADCAVCADGFSSVYGFNCINCSNAVAIVGTILAVAALVIVSGLLAWLLWGSGGTRLQHAMDSGSGPKFFNKSAVGVATVVLKNIRIPLVMMQVLTQFVSISNTLLPETYQKFLVSSTRKHRCLTALCCNRT